MPETPKPPTGFVPLKSLTHGSPSASDAIAEIRRIYFRTTKQTIDADFAHAIELLKSLPDEETRARAAVFMEGLVEMRREWAMESRRSNRRGEGGTRKASTKAKVTGGGGKKAVKPKPPTR